MASDGSPRRATPKSDRTRELILDAARTAFARKGFSGVTIKDITDLAPITRANFYYYFSDKTQLFIELGTDTYREALAVVEGFMEQRSPPDRDDIEAWVAVYFAIQFDPSDPIQMSSPKIWFGKTYIFHLSRSNLLA